jgi:ATP-dependent Lhr-like helicase
MPSNNVLSDFHPLVRRWFERTYGEPSPPQQLGWPAIAAGRNTLILAPTGSGKTLAAFLWTINHLIEQQLREPLSSGVRVLYVSPLKALNNDIARNLEGPLSGIRQEAIASGQALPLLRSEVRTGDTPASKRRAMLTKPPDILITTPESLYLMLTSPQARKMFRTVQYVIVDEIHALCGNKRGVHLSLSLERLQEVADQEFVRIGLSATQRPLTRIAEFLGGYAVEAEPGVRSIPRPVHIVDAGQRKEMDLKVICAADDFSLLPQDSVWPLVFDEILEEIRAHKTTLIFVNNRRLAERVAATLNERITGAAETSFQLYNVPRSTEWTTEDRGATGRGEPRAADAPAIPADTDAEPDPATLRRGDDIAPMPLPETHPEESGAPEDTPAPRIPEQLVQAYHGSMSRDVREQMETDLKAGRLRALVATSALELGIDIGTVDLVIQLQSPKGIARGLQRVGRSGHLVSATSKGRVFVSHREDLVEALVVARAMQSHAVEETTVPENCLDVLAQQIVAMVGLEPWPVDRLYAVVRRSMCYHTLSRELFDRVIDMLAGRYAHEAFRDLRPRISWDRVNRVVAALPGTNHAALTGGGTIADRGYFGVYLEDQRTKVGEVDEEFVYESRSGDTFLLGSSVWRMLDIDANRIIVAPAPGQPARMPFWRGEGIGRSYELGLAVGRFRRELETRIDQPGCQEWLQREYPVDSRGAWNVLDYVKRQKETTGALPTDTTIVLESFRDELGDPRIVVHSCFGRRVNGLLGLLLSHTFTARTGIEPQMLYNDDGIMLRCPDTDTLHLDLLANLDVDAALTVVLNDIMFAPIFGGQFRQNAGRALLLPRTSPGKRTPLWLQRLRATDMLNAVRHFEDFPIVIETVREVLNDVLDFPRFRSILAQIADGSIQVTGVQTEIPSPFAASLLFDFIAVYMYEWDQPREDKHSQYLAVNRELLSEVVDLDTVASLVRPEAITAVESDLQHTRPGYRARTPEELMELLVRVGDLSEDEVKLRVEGESGSMLSALSSNGRAVRVQHGGRPVWIAGEDRPLYARLGSDEATTRILRRFVEHHGPTTSSELAERYGLDEHQVRRMTAPWADDHHMAHGRFRPPSMPGADQPQWCYRPNIERIHRQTISILRKEIQPCSLPEFVRFALSWHKLPLQSSRTEEIDLAPCVDQLAGLGLPVEVWEHHIVGARTSVPLASHAAALGAVPGLVWCGAGPGRIRTFRRGEGGVYLDAPDPVVQQEFSEGGSRVAEYLRQHGASFLNDIRSGTHLSLQSLNAALAELFWSGQITNDNLAEILQLRRTARVDESVPVEPVQVIGPHSRRRLAPVVQAARRAIRDLPGWQGRWSLIHHPAVLGEGYAMDDRISRQVDCVLHRYGILAREFFKREDLLPWSVIAPELQRRELRGTVRRGYFVEGLSGMQYALPGAVDMLRRDRTAPGSDTVVLLNACDPINPYGPGVELPFADGRVTRTPSSFIAFAGGTPVLLAELNGARLFSAPDASEHLIEDALTQLVGLTRRPPALRPFRHIHVELCNGTKPALDRVGLLLERLGFVRDAGQTMRYEGYA